MGFPGFSDGKESACSLGDLGLIPGLEDPLEKGTAVHCSIPAWRIPWTEEPGVLQSMGWQKLDMTERLSTAHKLNLEMSSERETSRSSIQPSERTKP